MLCCQHRVLYHRRQFTLLFFMFDVIPKSSGDEPHPPSTYIVNLDVCTKFRLYQGLSKLRHDNDIPRSPTTSIHQHTHYALSPSLSWITTKYKTGGPWIGTALFDLFQTFTQALEWVGSVVKFRSYCISTKFVSGGVQAAIFQFGPSGTFTLVSEPF